MEITRVDVRPMKNPNNPKMRAFVSITFDDEFAVCDIRLLQHENGDYFLAFPNKQITPGNYKDTAHPVNQATRDRFTDVVVKKYFEKLEEEEKVEDSQE